jgi:hypothetical protein
VHDEAWNKESPRAINCGVMPVAVVPALARLTEAEAPTLEAGVGVGAGAPRFVQLAKAVAANSSAARNRGEAVLMPKT